MSVRTLRTLDQLLVRDDGRLDADEAGRLVESSRDFGTVSADERAELRLLAAAASTTAAARDRIETFLSAPAPTAAPPLRAVAGPDGGRFTDDRLVLGPDGSDRGSSGVTPYTRSYAAVHEGTLRERHGSLAPHSSVLTPQEYARVSGQSPAAALDAAARARGLTTAFAAMANSPSNYDPNAPSWWGKCHAWAWSALSNELSARVDVGGPENQRGLWLSGQWVSRADLGNFMMGVADGIAVSDTNRLFQSPVTATDLLQATGQYLMNGGGGVVADIHNDAAHGGAREVWNQPFVAADVDTHTVSGAGADAVLALARREGHAGGAVKQVHVVGRYGNEVSDSYEGAWNAESRSWNVYAVTDAAGTVVAAYMADDPKLETVTGLPTHSSHELPDYLWKPTLSAAEAALDGSTNRTIDADPHAREYRFFVSTVLKRGVPGSTRAAFEAEVARLPARPITGAQQTALRRKYPGVAEAYTAEQWQKAFGARGLSAASFAAP